MATSNCPNCGKPLRPGSRFCGNCGATLPASPRQAATPADAPPGTPVCPHCGKPLRSSAKFCSSCGKPTETDSQSAVTVAVRPASTAEQPRPPMPAPRPGQPGAPVSTPAGAPLRNAPAATPRRKGMIAIAVAGLLVACVLLAGGGYISARQLGFIGKKTAVASIAQGTPASPAPLATTALVPGDLPTATQPVHTLPPSPSPSLFPTQALPTLVTPPPALPTVQTPAIVNLASPTVELLPTATFTSAPVQANDLFNDTFAGDAWKGHWLVWGNPRPLKRTGGGGSWLSLTAFEDPGSAGMTTRPEFPIPDAPGVEVEFEATLDNNYPGGIFLVDWDPRSNQRGPDNSRPGVFRLEIQSDRFLLSAAGVLPKCEFDFDFDALQKHIYLIRIQPGQVVEVYLDQAPQVACQVQLDVIGPQPGSISFSGIADLTRARVSVPLQP